MNLTKYLKSFRKWNCLEGEDEADVDLQCNLVPATNLPLCQRHQDDDGECSCPPGTRKCENNLCLSVDKWCNKHSDCGDMSDEPATCDTCLGKLSLTRPDQLCDGIRNCPDLSGPDGKKIFWQRIYYMGLGSGFIECWLK